jgi:hypothetical protein
LTSFLKTAAKALSSLKAGIGTRMTVIKWEGLTGARRRLVKRQGKAMGGEIILDLTKSGNTKFGPERKR